MEFSEGTLGGREAVVVQCGMGKVNAGICAQLLIANFAVTHVINTGAAGSLNAALNMDGRCQPDQQQEEPVADKGENRRDPPSILERLKQPGPARTGQPMRKENNREEAI